MLSTQPTKEVIVIRMKRELNNLLPRVEKIEQDFQSLIDCFKYWEVEKQQNIKISLENSFFKICKRLRGRIR